MNTCINVSPERAGKKGPKSQAALCHVHYLIKFIAILTADPIIKTDHPHINLYHPSNECTNMSNPGFHKLR